MEFIEAPAFTRHLPSYLDDEQYRALQAMLMLNLEAGDVIQGTGGFRKIRWMDTRRGKGKRGGLRVIYYHFAESEQIWLMTLYGKDEAENLTPRERRALKAAITNEKRVRAARRSHRRR